MCPFSLLLLSLLAACTAAISAPQPRSSHRAFDRCLREGLSKRASVVLSSSAAPRWSEFEAPMPGTVINVATEKDVQVAVRCCNRFNLTFLASAGGNGWATTFTIDQKGVAINLRGLNQVTFNTDKTQVTVQGGTIISELVGAAYDNDAQVVTGNCDCVGVMGAMLGGGYGRLMGEYGLMVDNVLSMNLVTAAGTMQTVTASSDPDLWFALRGAGANFAIVTSAVMKSYPTPRAQNGAWLGALIYSPDSIEALVGAINGLTLSPKMAIFMYYATSGAPDYNPVVIVLPFYLGSAADGRSAFDPVLQVGPLVDNTAWTPYNQVNAGSGSFCVPGDRKPSYGAAAAQLDPATWRTIWNEFNHFVTTNGGDKVGNSTVLMEAYSLDAAKAKGDESSSSTWRSTNTFNMVATAWYKDASFDPVAQAFGSKIRDLMRNTGNLPGNPTYVNFAFGDESLQQIYGPNLARLQALKKRYDERNRFNQFFPLV